LPANSLAVVVAGAKDEEEDEEEDDEEEEGGATAILIIPPHTATCEATCAERNEPVTTCEECGPLRIRRL
jgi:hypothetical protein